MTASPRILPAFLVANFVWLLPALGRWATLGDTAARFFYEALVQVVMIGGSLAVISVIFRFATRRGASLVSASARAVVAVVPVTTAVYLIDAWVATWNPSLSILAREHLAAPKVALVASLTDAAGVCLFLSAVVFLPVFARAHADRMRELESVHRDAELLRIRAHLEPHFVLNSLNAVAGLVEEDPTQARELLAALGDLFRQATSFRSTHRVLDEVEWLRRYVTIHELRHPDRLETSWDISADVEDLECPALILQPLVENAIKHGALRGGGALVVRACAEGDAIVLAVEDDGPELGPVRAGGQGLAIVERRLALEGLPADAFRLARRDDRTVATVRLPARKGPRHA